MITIHLDSKSKIPLYEQIYEHIKGEIQNGSLLFGSKLPSSRSLSAHLFVSRNTIEMAYGQLLSEGYIESIEKKGYYICQVSRLEQISPIKETQFPLSKTENIGYKFDFSPFAIDSTHFPYTTWKKLTKNSLDTNNQIFLLGDGQGDLPFRNAILKYLHSSRGVSCSAKQILIGAGIEYLLQILLQLFPKRSVIAMENPAYKQAYHVFFSLNYKVVPIELDKNGMDISILSHCHANVAYVTPSHQYPLGIVMPIKRRLELLNWATEKKGNYIIEDDHDSEFRYKGKPIPALKGLDTKDKVIYMGTFSRAIAPAIRVSYMVLPDDLLEIYEKYFRFYSCTVSRVDQSILTAFLDEGYFERHLNRMRKLYKNKHDKLIHALKIFGNNIEIQGENAGLHLVVKIHTTLSETEVIQLAKQADMKLYGISPHYIIQKEKTTFPTFLFGYANITEEAIEKGIKHLYTILTPYFISFYKNNFTL